MIANTRQYDRLYRLDDLYRDPLDHGLRILFGANPVLFVGLGMNEDEINQVLQYYVGNTPVHRSAPLFVLWNRDQELKTDDDKKAWADTKRKKRLDFRRRLGVDLLFDDELFIEKEPEYGVGRPDPRKTLPMAMQAIEILGNRVDSERALLPLTWRESAEAFPRGNGGQPHRM